MSRPSDPPPANAVPTGPEIIKAALKTLPPAPGVYRMIDARGEILYIGKAKNLINRVGSYAQMRDLSTRIVRMVSQVAAVEFTPTKSEAEAFLVEANFIRRYKPRYNILLKDDKSFPYLLIQGDHPFPRIEKHRGAKTRKGEYFGPYASVGALNDAIALLQKIFLLRPCSDSYFKARTRPCLQYQIKRCSAPCVGLISPPEYARQLERARGFLRGQHRDIQAMLSQEMQAASAAQDYEQAALLRDRIRALTQVQQEHALHAAGLHDADAIALARQGNRSVVMVSFFRQGSHFGQQHFSPRHESDAGDGEILAAFIGQFYQRYQVPPEILVSQMPDEPESLSEALALDCGHKVSIQVPQRGDKRRLIEGLADHAQRTLERQAMEQAAVAQHLAALQKLLALPRLPQRIEVYDNSHLAGRHAVGAFIVATPEGFDKKSYRTYQFKADALMPGDDYGMMREVFTRRFKALASPAPLPGADADSTAPPLPDLVLIDGGLGQLHAVSQALEGYDTAGITFLAIAKGRDRNAGREWFYLDGREPFQLPPHDPLLHYLQRLRDEAHRYAIGRHRQKRARGLSASALDDIPGIGGGRKRALLAHFGSRKAVETASLTELQRVAGISQKTAQRIFDYFHA